MRVPRDRGTENAVTSASTMAAFIVPSMVMMIALSILYRHLRQFPDTAFTPHQVGKVLVRSSGAVANSPITMTSSF